MKKLLTVVCLSGLLSVPSVVFAEASWYGSLRAGISSSGQAGVADGGSRWGIMGSSEVSEGLTAVYRFEHRISTANAGQSGGRLAYVGLSGGFGTLTIGQIWSASYNSFGAITDNSYFFGDAETSYRNGHSVSYAVTVENISIQADVIMNQGWGNGSTPAKAAVAAHAGADDMNPGLHGAVAAVTAQPEDDNVDQFELGVSMGLGENASIAFAHRSADNTDDVKLKSNYIAGQYTIGSMTAYLGVARHKTTDSTALGDRPTTAGTTNTQLRSQADSTTFAGVRGSVGDTGVTYIFQARGKKSKGTNEVQGFDSATDGESSVASNKRTPWLLNLSRSLGGGASVHFEHNNLDNNTKAVSYLALKVDF